MFCISNFCCGNCILCFYKNYTYKYVCFFFLSRESRTWSLKVTLSPLPRCSYWEILKYLSRNTLCMASLVAQGLKKKSAWQCKTRIRSLVWEDPTCCRATKAKHHNCWACALEPGNHNCWAHVLHILKLLCPRVRAPQQEKPQQREARASAATGQHCQKNNKQMNFLKRYVQ